ncbi:MAG TPA: phosphatidate cytidylyltransferase [Actinomycetota bacterium]|nr:phosphatidate cytidylyltransferase [Actinomycetota bacterium]
MGLYALKPWFVTRLRRAEDLLSARRVAPDAVTAAGVIAAVLAGAAIALGGILNQPIVWLAVPFLAVLRLACNALDGSVARRTKTARPAGVVVNEVADRIADAALIGGAAFVVDPGLAFGAVAVAFLTSVTGVLALAVVGERATSGPMSKADRTMVVAVAAVAAPVAGPVAFTVAAWTIVAGGIITCARRTLATARRAQKIHHV